MILFQDDIWTRRNVKKDTRASPWVLKKIRRKILLSAVLTLFIYIMVYYLHSKIFTETNSHTFLGDHYMSSTNKSQVQYLVNMPHCKIPYVDPFDPSVKRIVKKTGSRECPHNMSLTYQTGLELRINWTAAMKPPYNGFVSYCTYKPLFRPQYQSTHKNYLRYLEESDPFYDSVKIRHEFVQVNCYNKLDRNIYVNFHGFIQRNETMDSIYNERVIRHVARGRLKEQMNVIMIGMDSVSRLSFIRQMVKTRAFLEDELESFDMMGYNKVADNTFINIVPMTLGKFVQEMSWDDHQKDLAFDGYDFIWKQFSDYGYRTFYAEDAPDIAIFDFLKAGFKTPPADHFNRPMSVAMEMKEGNWFNNHHCFQGRLETDIVLNYLSDFIETYQNDPYFAFTFITRLSHDDVNSAGAADEPYFNFFDNLHKKDLLKNSVIFFFSDHGMRFGKIRETPIGKLEERLPFMHVVIPKWLRVKYPEIPKLLEINKNRLSTPFDVYETLRDVLEFDGIKKTADVKARGVSWLREIPFSRSCDKAGVLPHWCTCLHHVKLSTDDDAVIMASSIMLEEIKYELRKYVSICENLSLRYIKEAVELVETSDNDYDTNLRNKTTFSKRPRDIQVVIETVPGNAVFEATVRLDMDLGVNKVVGDISRITIYGHQADCIDVFKLKKYCQCIDLER